MDSVAREWRGSKRQAPAVTLLCVAVAALLWVLMAGSGGYARTYTRTEPLVSDIAGTYVPAEELPVLPSTQPEYRVPHLVLNADGSARFVDFAVSLHPPALPGKDFLSGEGTWRLYRHEDYWVIGLSCDKRSLTLHLCNQKSPYVLLDYVDVEHDTVRLMVKHAPET
mgnify:CR=1 FL=1